MLFLDPRFLGQGLPQISDMHFQIALTPEHVAGLVEFRSASSGVADENRRKKKERMAVKRKSADEYVGLPKNR